MVLARDSEGPAASWQSGTKGGSSDSHGQHDSNRFTTSSGGGLRLADDATYASRARRSLVALCEACGPRTRLEQLIECQELLLSGWGDAEVPREPPYPSNIGDDHSPYEYSLAFEPHGVELRLLVEAQAQEPTPRANQLAALQLNARLLARYGAAFERFDAISDLFLVDEPRDFSLWHAVCWKPSGRTDFKVYLNPQANGRENALALVSEAFSRLGLKSSVGTLARMMCRGEADELKYFSLDLSRGPEARVKVYAAHRDAHASEVEDVLALSPQHRPGDVTGFCRDLIGYEGPFSERAVTTCLSFTSASSGPSAATFHLPIAHYVPDDATTFFAVSRLLRQNGMDVEPYQKAFIALAQRPLPLGCATQSYASFRRERGALRVTTYLSPRLFGDRFEPEH